MVKTLTKKQQFFKDFMANVNKLSVGRSTYDKYFGNVKLYKKATGYGTRRFSVSDSLIMNAGGNYSLGTIRKQLVEKYLNNPEF